jgi:predicted metalloprotease
VAKSKRRGAGWLPVLVIWAIVGYVVFNGHGGTDHAAPNGEVATAFSPAKPNRCVKGATTCTTGEMKAAAAGYSRLVTDYYARVATFKPPTYLWIPTKSTKRNGCRSDSEHPSELKSGYLFYCTRVTTVYVGQDAVWGMYHIYGYLVPLLVLAHETAHALQDADGASLKELQADCLAGAMIGYARSHHWISSKVDVIGQTIKMFADIAEYVGESPSDTHGSLDERRRWMTAGLTNGAGYCNRSFGGKLKLK